MNPCETCKEHSGIVTAQEMHTTVLTTIEKRFSQVIIGVFMIMLVSLINLAVVVKVKPVTCLKTADHIENVDDKKHYICKAEDIKHDLTYRKRN